MKPSIFIVGQRPDPHIDAVEAELLHRGAQVWIFDRLAHGESTLTYAFEREGPRGTLTTAGGRCDLAELDAVWWRVKPTTLTDLGGDAPSPAARFARREWRSALEALPTFSPAARWVNARTADLRARHKPTQLLVAGEAGWTVPRTRITNDPDAALAFFPDADGSRVYKPLSWHYEPPDRLLFTNEVAGRDVEEDPEALRLAPGIFQALVPKEYEVRATVVGDRVFAVRIDSQSRQDTRLDWRRNQGAVQYTPCTLPEPVEERLRATQRALGLAYGAYDLIVTPDGEHVFLEVNPAGQWLWLEHATGLPISAHLAGLLCGDEAQ